MGIIKYEGKSNYIIILFKEKEKLYVLYARTDSLALNSEVENSIDFLDDYEYIKTRCLKRDFAINIPLLKKGNKVFSIIQVDNEKAYDLIKTVVEDLL